MRREISASLGLSSAPWSKRCHNSIPPAREQSSSSSFSLLFVLSVRPSAFTGCTCTSIFSSLSPSSSSSSSPPPYPYFIPHLHPSYIHLVHARYFNPVKKEQRKIVAPLNSTPRPSNTARDAIHGSYRQFQTSFTHSTEPDRVDLISCHLCIYGVYHPHACTTSLIH